MLFINLFNCLPADFGRKEKTLGAFKDCLFLVFDLSLLRLRRIILCGFIDYPAVLHGLWVELPMFQIIEFGDVSSSSYTKSAFDLVIFLFFMIASGIFITFIFICVHSYFPTIWSPWHFQILLLLIFHIVYVANRENAFLSYT